jgi:isoleucyl-tRNA synthetase
MLNRIYKLDNKFHNYFKNYDFHNLYKDLLNFCTVDLSAFYFDIRKDALYCDPINSDKRNSCLKVLNIILESLLKWFAPILSFTTEEIYKLLSTKNKSIHLEKFIVYPESFKNDQLENKWNELIKVRDICNISIEEKRANKIIGSSLEAELNIKLNSRYQKILKDMDLSELCITSKAQIIFTDSDNILVETSKALGEKCPVCWKISIDPCSRHKE